jgi:hypothetical protein
LISVFFFNELTKSSNELTKVWTRRGDKVLSVCTLQPVCKVRTRRAELECRNLKGFPHIASLFPNSISFKLLNL